VKKVVEEAKNVHKIKSVRVNRVLIAFDGWMEDLDRFLVWCTRIGVSAKLYEMIWTDKISLADYEKNYLSWRRLLPRFWKEAEEIVVKRFSWSGRERLFVRLKSGLDLEVDVFSVKTDSFLPEVCRQCDARLVCREGLFSYGFELGPDFVLSPCLLRKDLDIPLGREIEGGSWAGVMEKIAVAVDNLV